MPNLDKMSSFHVEISAEAIAAGQFARLGFDVSVQYGARQPEYDLIVAKGERLMKVSVKGSQDGSWGLTQRFLTKGKADYAEAVTKWLAKHSMKTVFCLVQFKGAHFNEMPRMYLATPTEIAEQLMKTANGAIGTILHENKSWGRLNSHGYGSVDKIPDHWIFTHERVFDLLGL